MICSPSSCYILEFSIRPGGGRWAELHAYSDPEHIRRMLAAFCKNEYGTAAYNAIWHDAVLGVWIVQRGVVVELIDLHAHITARLPRKQPVSLVDRAGLNAMFGLDEGHVVDDELLEQIKLAERDD